MAADLEALERIAKRIVVGVLSALGLVLVLGIAKGLLTTPGEEWKVVVQIGSAVLAAFIVTRMPRWSQWRPSNRVGAMFLVTFVPPPLVMSSLVGYEPGMAIGPFLTALAITGTWWTVWGYALEHPAEPASEVSGS